MDLEKVLWVYQLTNIRIKKIGIDQTKKTSEDEKQNTLKLVQ